MQGIYLNDLGLKFVKTCFTNYWGQIYFFGVFVVAVLWFFLAQKHRLKYFSLYTFFLFLTIYNPVLVKIFFKYFNQDSVYYRFFWLLPVNLVITYLIVHSISCISNCVKRAITLCVIICMIVLLGSPVKYFSSLLNVPDNLYKVSDDLLEVSEYIHQDTDTPNPRVAVSADLLMTIRQYDPTITLTTVRDYALCWQGLPDFQYLLANSYYSSEKSIMDVIYGGDYSNPEAFSTSIAETATQYLVFSKTVDIQPFLQSMNYQYIAETANYIIYRLPSV